MPTFNQLVRKGRKMVTDKSTSPALQRGLNTTSVLVSIGVTALISGATIGGKALGKKVAINDSTNVVYRVARIMATLHLFR